MLCAEIGIDFFISLQRSNVEVRILKHLYGMCGADLALAHFWIFSDTWSCRSCAPFQLYWGQMKSPVKLKRVCLQDWWCWNRLSFKKKCSGKRADCLWGVGNRGGLLHQLEDCGHDVSFFNSEKKNQANLNKFQGRSQIFFAYLNSESLHLFTCSSS